MTEEKKRWYVVYTKPRWEKKVYGLLFNRGLEVYCPLNRVRKSWSDRVKWIEEPLFKSYVFVRAGQDDLSAVRHVNGVLNFVYWLGKPAIVKDGDIDLIRKFLNDHKEVEVEPVELKEDARVTIRQGVLMNRQAKVVKVMNKRVRVVIESIGYALVAVVEKMNIRINEKADLINTK